MGASVFEYLGQRTDVISPVIIPEPANSGALCPFRNASCSKLNKKPYQPICSIKRPDGRMWLVCEHRLCCTTKTLVLNPHQKNMLRQVAQTIFAPSISDDDILIKREEKISAGATDYNADFIMVNNSADSSVGPDRVVLEMQGGGETSNTQSLSSHVRIWENCASRTNALLAQNISNVNTIETNAWRRQQEQFIVKGRSAMLTRRGAGMVFCVGPVLFDYLNAKVEGAGLRTNLRNYGWTLALLCFDEDTSISPIGGPVPLIIDSNRMLFTDYQAFVRALTDQGNPSPQTFTGVFESLSGLPITL